MSLTAERLREVLHYDKETGIFTRRIDSLLPRGGIRVLAGSVAGSPDGLGYLRMRVDANRYKAHRLAFLYVNGVWPEKEVDHINGTRDDNRWENLRDVTRSTNQQNQRIATKKNRSGLLGACFYAHGFRAQLVIDGKNRCLGTFKTAYEAHAAYLDAKRLHHPGCTI